MQKLKTEQLNVIAILSIFLFSGAGSFMNPAVQTMMDAWPQISATNIRMVTSLPFVVSLPITILIGNIAGKRLSYRFCAIFGTSLILVFGIAPFFFHSSWMLVLVFRAMVGVGVGFVAMRNALILKSVPEHQQATVIGYGSSMMNAGTVISGPIVGMLTVYGWQYPFLYDIAAVVPLLFMIFFLKEPKTGDVSGTLGTACGTAMRQTEHKRPGWRIVFYIVAQFIMTAALYPLLSGMATYMTEKSIGNALLAGMVNSVYCLAGVLINVILSPIEKRLRQYSLSVMCVIFSLGMALVLFVPKLSTILIGAILTGISFNIMMSLFQLYNGKEADPQWSSLTATILIASLSLGNFASVYFINICHMIFRRSSDVESAYFGGLLLYLVFAVLMLLCKAAPEVYYEKKEG